MKNIAENAQRIIEPIAEELGLWVVEVEYKRGPHGMALTVYCDKEGGVSLQDLEKLHRAVDGPLDELDPTDGAPYTLNVSSPGLDRPLKTDRDLNKYIGKEIEVSLYAAQDGKKKFVAVLCGFDSAVINLESAGDSGPLNIKRGDIANIKPVIKF